MPHTRIRLARLALEFSTVPGTFHLLMIPVAWRRVDAVGFERGELANGLDGFRLRGTLGLMEGGDSFDASYEVACDSAWVTQSVTVELRGPKGEKCLRLAKRRRSLAGRGPDRRHASRLYRHRPWVDSVDEHTADPPARPSRSGIKAADRRLGPLPGAHRRTAAQQYSRLDERRYRYASAGGRYSRQLEVDEHGLVTTYGHIWTRV